MTAALIHSQPLSERLPATRHTCDVPVLLQSRCAGADVQGELEPQIELMGDELETSAARGAGQLRSGAQARRQPTQKGQSSEEPSKSRSAPSAADRQPASEQKEGKLRKRFMRWPLSGLAEKALLRAGVDEDVSR